MARQKRISSSWIQAVKAGRESQAARMTGDLKEMELAKRRVRYHLGNVVGLGQKKKLKKVI